MKRMILAVLLAALLCLLAACSNTPQNNAGTETPAQQTETSPAASEPETGETEEEPAPAEWTRTGWFEDEDGNVLSVTLSDTEGYEGWHVGCILGEEMYGNIIGQEGSVLKGDLVPDYEEGSFPVTVSEEGEDGLLLTLESGTTYHFKPAEMPTASFSVFISTEGLGHINYAQGDATPDMEELFTSAQINLADAETYTLAAAPEEGWRFVKWVCSGEDYSTEPMITLVLDESADFVAVFEEAEEEDGQNPVMNFIGQYVSGRARAQVECQGSRDALVTIEWGDSAWSLARWVMSGRFDEDSMTVEYNDGVMTYLTYNDEGELESEEIRFENGTGRIVFDGMSSFTWDDDQDDREPLTFEWSYPGAEEEDGQNPVMNFIGEYAAGRAHALVECEGAQNALVTIEWGDSAWSLARWVMSGWFDEETMTVEYYNSVMTYVTYNDEGGLESEELQYEGGTGRIIFNNEGGFTWEEDQDDREPLTFEWSYEGAFEEEDGQNPAMNVVGEYQAGRAHALVECEGPHNARITIEWGDSAWSLARWVMSGWFDEDTLTVEYYDGVMTYVTYNDEGELVSEELQHEGGTGRIVFDGMSGFTWDDDQDDREPLTFEWSFGE